MDKYFEFLEDKVFNGVFLTDNHNNHDFLEFWDKFYPNKPFEKVKANFHYHMKKLTGCGMCQKGYTYLNGRDFSNIGRRTIITYTPLITKRNIS